MNALNRNMISLPNFNSFIVWFKDIGLDLMFNIYMKNIGSTPPPLPELQTPRLIVSVTNSPPTSTILHIPISLYIDNYLPA